MIVGTMRTEAAAAVVEMRTAVGAVGIAAVAAVGSTARRAGLGQAVGEEASRDMRLKKTRLCAAGRWTGTRRVVVDVAVVVTDLPVGGRDMRRVAV